MSSNPSSEAEAVAAFEVFKAYTRAFCQITADIYSDEEDQTESLLEFIRSKFRHDAHSVEEAFPGSGFTRIDQLPIPDSTSPPLSTEELEPVFSSLLNTAQSISQPEVEDITLPLDYVEIMKRSNGLTFPDYPAALFHSYILRPVSDISSYLRNKNQDLNSVVHSLAPKTALKALRKEIPLLEGPRSPYKSSQLSTAFLCGWDGIENTSFWYALMQNGNGDGWTWRFVEVGSGIAYEYDSLTEYLLGISRREL